MCSLPLYVALYVPYLSKYIRIGMLNNVLAHRETTVHLTYTQRLPQRLSRSAEGIIQYLINL